MRNTTALLLVLLSAAVPAAAMEITAIAPAPSETPASAPAAGIPAAAVPAASAPAQTLPVAAAAVKPVGPARTEPAASAPATPAASVARPASTKNKDAQLEQMEKESSVLAPEKAKAYNEAMSKAIDESAESRNKIRKTYEEADALLTAETFDKKAFLAKANEIDTLYAQSRAKLNEIFASTIENYTQAERKALLKSRNENRKRPAHP